MVKINLNISNRSFILISFLLIIIIGGGIVIAYNSAGNPVLMGHSLNEVAMPACTNGQAIVKQSDGSWGCGSGGGGNSNLLVVHSQSTSVPGCPSGWNQLWTGYSLLMMSSYPDYTGNSQDLGDAGSCLEVFNPIPFLECYQSSTSCDYFASEDWSYWLSATSTDTGSLTVTDTKNNYVSRCAVCEKEAPLLVRHSMTTSAPSCPSGWTPLWTGYSFAQSTGSNGIDGVQDLSSPGSCLQIFRPIPFLECSLSACDYVTGGDEGGWLTPQTTDTGTLSGIDTIKNSYVSKCVVCSK